MIAQHPDVRAFFVGNLVKNAYQKVCDRTKGTVLDLLKVGTVHYTLDEADQASAPEILVAGTPLRAIESAKTTRRFARPNESRVALTLRQLVAVTVFDPKLVDAAVTAGVLSVIQAAAIELESDRSPFPLVQLVK